MNMLILRAKVNKYVILQHLICLCAKSASGVQMNIMKATTHEKDKLFAHG